MRPIPKGMEICPHSSLPLTSNPRDSRRMGTLDLAVVPPRVKIAKEVAKRNYDLVIIERVYCLAMLVSLECKGLQSRELDAS